MPKETVEDTENLEEKTTGFLPDLPYEDEPEETAADEAKRAEEDRFAALEAQIKASQEEIASLRATNMSLLQQPVTAQRQFVLPPPEKPDFKGLPNPIDDPEGYAMGVSERTMAHQERIRQYNESLQAPAVDRENRMNALWSDFQVEYEDYAKDQSRVIFATQQVIDRAQKRGIDVDRYMFVHSDQFMKDVTKEMDTVFGKPGGKPAPRAKGSDGPVDRSAGMFGGIEAGGKPVAAKRSREDGEDDTFAEIRKFQIANGLYR